ncbi:uncharacterized protein [Nicotiana tomentosiformis]|uniref:uncharacterized protein n=1 Tax=Nicotiana tomentosiformis TaxID=4098 RepID=UPI00388C6411
MTGDFELWDVICNGPYVSTKKLRDFAITMPKNRKEYNDADRKAVEKNFRAKNIFVCGIGPDEYNRISSCQSAKEIWEALQTAHEGTTQVKQSKIDMLTTENKLVRKILSVLPSSWESKVNAITEAKDLQILTMDELVRNLKTYEIKRKKDSEKREPKKEKNLVLKAENNDSSEEDSDMAYLNRSKNISSTTLIKQPRGTRFLTNASKEKNASDNVVKQALVAWGDSSSESEEENDAGDNSMMAVENEANEYDSIFALMAQSDDDEDDDNDEGTVKGSSQQWIMNSGCSKHMTRNTMDFLSLKALQRGNVSFVNGKKGYILGVGKVEKSLSHSIENVYYVNGLKYSLLSVFQICDKGNKVEFLLEVCTVTNLVTGELVLDAKRYKNIYVADFESLQSGDMS